MKLADIVETYQTRFEQQYAKRITPPMRHAMAAVRDCRTPRYGEMRLRCTHCHAQASKFHSCGHRSCPGCQHYDTTQWLQRQTLKLLPVDYFMATFTVPRELRSLFWCQQSRCYAMLFECAVNTLKTFGINDPKLGAEQGMTAVLHTHSRQLAFHPHVHIILPGGCLLMQRRQWKKLHGNYLFNEINLAKVFRARFLDAMVRGGLLLPKALPAQWVVNCKHVGKGLPALQYLARYLYRGVISEKNILHDDGTHIIFRYLDSKTNTYHCRKLKGEQFLWRVFMHVLPKGFRRVRDFGLLHGNAKAMLHLVQLLLTVCIPTPTATPRPVFKCVHCQAPMRIAGFIPPAWRAG
jgi:hypothetical protein